MQAILNDLVANYGLTNDSEILLWGDSAGAFGVLINVDFVANFVPGARVQGVVNSGWFLNYTTFLPGEPTLDEIYTAAVEVFNPYANQLCLANSSTTPSEIFCLHPNNFYPFINQNLFFIQSVLDSFELLDLLDFNTSYGNYSESFAIGVSTYYNTTLNTLWATKPDDGYYLLSCYLHVPSITSPFISNITATEAVINWYFNLGSFKFEDGCLPQSAVSIQYASALPPCYNVTQTCAKASVADTTFTTMIMPSASNSSSPIPTGINSSANAMTCGILAFLILCACVILHL